MNLKCIRSYSESLISCTIHLNEKCYQHARKVLNLQAEPLSCKGQITSLKKLLIFTHPKTLIKWKISNLKNPVLTGPLQFQRWRQMTGFSSFERHSSKKCTSPLPIQLPIIPISFVILWNAKKHSIDDHLKRTEKLVNKNTVAGKVYLSLTSCNEITAWAIK